MSITWIEPDFRTYGHDRWWWESIVKDVEAREPTIRIVAPVAVGKTTVAAEIARHLSSLGFEVEIHDLDGRDVHDGDSPEKAQLRAERLQAVASRTKISICTLQAPHTVEAAQRLADHMAPMSKADV